MSLKKKNKKTKGFPKHGKETPNLPAGSKGAPMKMVSSGTVKGIKVKGSKKHGKKKRSYKR